MSFGNSISSNVTGLAIAEETSLKVLPGTPDWYTIAVNTYGEFGAENQTTQRDTLNELRQVQKGTITDVDAAGAFTIDFTQENFVRSMQGFMFADAHEKYNSDPLNGTKKVISDIDGAGIYTTSGTGFAAFLIGDLIKASGNSNGANNALGRVTASTATTVDTDIATIANASPAAASKIETIGFAFNAGDATIVVSGGQFTLGATTKDLTQLGLKIGEWIYIGGDVTDSAFASGTGYARVLSIAASAIVCDKATYTVVNDTGVGKSVRVFFGTHQNNAKTAGEIVCRSYQLERQLGNDGSGIQSEVLVGCGANEFTMNMPVGSKLTADLGFVSLDSEERTGTQGLKAGNRHAALGEDPYNTSSNLFRLRMAVIDPASLNPTPLFAFVEEFSLAINNNIESLKAVGVLGGFSFSIGNFEVTGATTAYFTTTEAITAVRANSDVTIDAILAKQNAGVVFDIPLLTLKLSGLSVEKNQAVKAPLETAAAQSPQGYTLGVTFFHYLPTVAMPVAS